MPSITSSGSFWGAEAVVSVFGNDELGLVSVTTGAAIPAAPSGTVFRVLQDSFYNTISSAPFAIVTPANAPAAAIPSANFNAGVSANAITLYTTNAAITLAPNTTYLWIYHFPKH